MMLCRFSERELGLLKVLMNWAEVLVDTPNPDHVTAWLKRQEQHHGVLIKDVANKLGRLPEPFLRTLLGGK